MNALANRRFLKMNGLGNQITVLDLRGSKHVVSEAEACAIASEPRARFDQLMVLHDAATPGTDAFVRIYNTDGSEAGACGNGTRCVAWAMTADPRVTTPSTRSCSTRCWAARLDESMIAAKTSSVAPSATAYARVSRPRIVRTRRQPFST